MIEFRKPREFPRGTLFNQLIDAYSFNNECKKYGTLLGKNMKLLFNNKEIYKDRMKNPMIFKIEYENNSIVDIEEISVN